ncbi:uncharacterized protein LOC134818627 [Bolinopsis microptera]|uniref:uncharacterized protein LOC134818627 n=1 Tax=Bolinopsis microptera TaxID=2820187 RepID=UPI00307AF948
MCGLVAVDFVAIFYNKNKGVCVMYGSVPEFNFTNITNETVLTKKMMGRDMNKKIAWSCALAAPMPFIMICVVLSLRHLKMARVRALNTRGGHKAHSNASTTVIIFTLVYVICNFPMLGYLGYLKYLISNTMSDWDDWNKNSEAKPPYVNESAGEGYYYMLYYDHLYNDVYSSFERYYAWIAVFDVPTALNSMINPIIYYWRMKPFRDYIHHRIQEMTSSHNSDPTKSRNNESGMPNRTTATPKLSVNTTRKGVQSIGTPNSCRGMGPDTANRAARKRDISLERSDDIVGDSCGNV